MTKTRTAAHYSFRNASVGKATTRLSKVRKTNTVRQLSLVPAVRVLRYYDVRAFGTVVQRFWQGDNGWCVIEEQHWNVWTNDNGATHFYVCTPDGSIGTNAHRSLADALKELRSLRNSA